MKHLSSYQLFEARAAKAPALDKSIEKRLQRAIDQGYLDNYDVKIDHKNGTGKLYVNYNNKYSKNEVYPLQLLVVDEYRNKNSFHYTLPHNDDKGKKIVTPSGEIKANSYNTFVYNILKVSKLYVKDNKKSTISFNGKEYPNDQILNLLQDDEWLNKIKQDMNMRIEVNQKGTLTFTSIDQEEYNKKEYDLDPEDFKVDPKYSISKTGKVYLNPKKQPLTIYNSAPLNSVEMYSKALHAVYVDGYLKHLEKWKSKYAKDSSIMGEIPYKYLKVINPKLARVSKNIGVFDADEF